MELQENSNKLQNNTEKVVLVIYSTYDIIMAISAMLLNMPEWVSMCMIIGMMFSWILYVGKFKSYTFRAHAVVTIMQILFVLYSINVEDIISMFSIFIALVLSMSFYGMAEMVSISMVTVTFLIGYHLFVSECLNFANTEDGLREVFRIMNVYFSQFIVYLWTKKRAENDNILLDIIRRLKVAEKSKDNFLVNISHEIRTPINTICGISELLLKDKSMERKLRDSLLNVQSSGRNLMSVVSDIMDFSELQTGKIKIQEEEYNIVSMINDVINMTLAKKKDKNIEFIVECDVNIPRILLGDEKKIRRILMNLINNAIKFTNEGYVSLVVGCRKEKYGVNLSFTVHDTGIGMTEESLERIFTTFGQVDASANRHEGGIGVGLTISQALLQQMGGIMTVKSQYGKGSTFKFVVPQKVVDEQPMVELNNPEEINAAVYINLEQFSMMEIRDEYSSIIGNMIKQLKVKCHVCRNFAELKRRCRKNSYTHVITSTHEYQENKEFFDELSKELSLIVVIDRWEEQYMANSRIKKIIKPFYVVLVVAAVNGEDDVDAGDGSIRKSKFIAPDVHVLVVDDNEMNIYVIEGLLDEYKIKVTKAFSGMEALEKIETMNYDFVFMDHMMPGMDGIEALEKIRSKSGSYYKNVPVLALTANAVAGSREMFLEAGFTDFVEKPVETSVLDRVLRRNIPKEKQITYEGNVEEITVTEVESSLIDVKKGYSYCGGKQKYEEILQMYAKQGMDTVGVLRECYKNADWHNYTVAVHGIKSSMASIGATECSEMAKQLEMSGKRKDISYIEEHTDELFDMLDRVFAEIRRIVGWEENQEEQENVCSLEELHASDFERKLVDFEEAMYSFDSETMSNIIETLSNYQYRGIDLSIRLEPVRRKVKQSDYMSAMEQLFEIKEEVLSRNEVK